MSIREILSSFYSRETVNLALLHDRKNLFDFFLLCEEIKNT